MVVLLPDDQKFREEEGVHWVIGQLPLQLLKEAGQKMVQLLPAVDHAVLRLKGGEIAVEQMQVLRRIGEQHQSLALDAVGHFVLMHGVSTSMGVIGTQSKWYVSMTNRDSSSSSSSPPYRCTKRIRMSSKGRSSSPRSYSLRRMPASSVNS